MSVYRGLEAGITAATHTAAQQKRTRVRGHNEYARARARSASKAAAQHAKQCRSGGGCAWDFAPSGGRSGRGTPRSHWPPGRSAGSRATPAPRRRPTCGGPHRGQSQPYGSTASRHVGTLRGWSLVDGVGECVDSFHIQVVRGLVEQEHCWQQRLRQSREPVTDRCCTHCGASGMPCVRRPRASAGRPRAAPSWWSGRSRRFRSVRWRAASSRRGSCRRWNRNPPARPANHRTQ